MGRPCLLSSLHAYFVTKLSHMQMGGAPEVAAHLERMQPASAPAARLLRPAALAGALMKPSMHVLLHHINQHPENVYLPVLSNTCPLSL